jgi:DNA-binding beta-propeller fold protein YncE
LADGISMEHDHNQIDEPAAASVLDRQITIPLEAGRVLPIALALVSAILLRLPGLDRWPLTPAEGELAYTARNLLIGNDLPSGLLGQPFLLIWNALFQFLGHSTDSVVRMSAALPGIALIGLAATLGWRFGRVPAAAAAVLLAWSPTMVAGSRRADAGMVEAFLVLALIAFAIAASRTERPGFNVGVGVAAGALLLSGPAGVVGLLLAVLAVVLIEGVSSLPNGRSLLWSGGAFVGTWVLVSTAFLTRPGSFLSSTGEVFRQIGSEHFANAGDRFHVPLFNLIIHEPLLLGFALLGLLAPARRELAQAFGIWFAVAFLLISALGDFGLAGHTLVVLPLGLLAGLGATWLVERIPWGLVRSGSGLLYMTALVLLLFAAMSLIGIVAPAGGLDGWTWLVNLVALMLFAVVPLVIFVSLIAPRITGHHAVLIVTAALFVISALTVRATVLAASERPGEPKDPLAQEMLAQSLPSVVSRIERVSIDLTRTQRTLEDPTGGHGIRIAIDERIEQPLAWYFREFPYVTVFDPSVDVPGLDTQVIFLAGERDPALSTPAMASETYVYRFRSPAMYRNPDWAGYLSSLFRVSDWREFWGFMVHRADPDPSDQENFHLALAPAIAERLFGPTGPFNLDEVAGAGTEGGQFNAPRGIATADDGRIYVVDAGNQRVQVFSPEGEFLSEFGSTGADPGQFGRFTGGIGGAGGIAIAGDRVFVADTWNHRIQAFDLDGTFLFEWGAFVDTLDNPDSAGSNPGLFYGPRGIAVDGDRVYVTDTGNERVQVFDLDGQFVTMWGTAGNDEGQLLEPVGIAVRDGVVYVADSHNSRIARFSTDGEVLESWAVVPWNGLRFFEPYLAFTADGRLLATTSVTNEMLLFAEDGTITNVPVGDVMRPYAAVAGEGNEMLVTDGLRNGVIRIVLPD